MTSTGTATAPVALVTGGAGGFGRAFARRLSARGYAIVVADLDADGAAEVATDVGGTPVRADVAKPEDTVAAVHTAVEAYGRLEVVALNAGVSSGLGPTDPLDLAAYRRIAGVNQDAVVYGLDAAVPHLRRTGGRVVVTASLAGLVPMPADPLYTLTKTAVVGYVRAVGPPLAELGVTVTALCPGFADTAILGAMREPLEAASMPLLSPDDVGDAFLAVLDAGKAGECWFVQPGREPGPYEFRGVPGPRRPGAVGA
ncbi:MAG TPA: SDR family NAD(P)-dependent oxidoreductase [Mycobacteriales bacterium]|nr:SDR family NAD(P)-dependent oxidoreductase [Mycobacteriales bacterium]